MAEDNIHFVSTSSGIIHKDSIYPARKSNCSEFLYVTDGCLYICEDYNEYRISQGQIILLDKLRRNYGFRECEADTLFRRLRFEGGENSVSITSGRKIFTPAHPERLEKLLDMLLLYAGLPEYPADALDSLTRLIVTEIFIYGIQYDDHETRRVVLCGKVCDYIREHKGAIKASHAAVHFGYTTRYLTDIFRGFYSKGMKAYIDAVRIAQIRELLGSGLSVGETAAETGFHTAGAMRRFIRYHTDMTLKEWAGEQDP